MEKNSIHTPKPLVTTWTTTVDILNPDPATIRLDEIATSLSRKGRYCDLNERRITVAQHLMVAWHCARAVPYTIPSRPDPVFSYPDFRAMILLHDAHEAYIGDIARPVKHLVDAETGGLIGRIEDGLDRAIYAALAPDLDIDAMKSAMSAAVRFYDNLALSFEVHAGFQNAVDTWDALPEPPPLPFKDLEAILEPNDVTAARRWANAVLWELGGSRADGPDNAQKERMN